jgi:hypothetical protein
MTTCFSRHCRERLLDFARSPLKVPSLGICTLLARSIENRVGVRKGILTMPGVNSLSTSRQFSTRTLTGRGKEDLCHWATSENALQSRHQTAGLAALCTPLDPANFNNSRNIGNGKEPPW